MNIINTRNFIPLLIAPWAAERIVDQIQELEHQAALNSGKALMEWREQYRELRELAYQLRTE